MTFSESLKPYLSKQYLLLYLLGLGLVILIGYLNASFHPLIILGGLILIILSLFIFKNPLVGILLIAFFLPFERIGSYEIQGLTIRISQVLTVVTLIAWMVSMVIKKEIKLVKNPLVIPLVFFIVINILSLIQAENIERSTRVFFFTLFTIIFSFLVTNLLKDKKIIPKLIKILLISMVLVCIFGLFQFFGDIIGLSPSVTGLREHYTKEVLGFPRIQSTALEPLYFANYLLIPLAIIYTFFLSRASKIKQGWLVLLFMLGGINLILTISRGGYLALVAVILVISLFYFKKFFTWKKIVSLIIILIITWLVVTQALGWGDPLNLETFKTHIQNAFYGASFAERMETFQTAQKAFYKSPWIGIGPGGFGPYSAIQSYVSPPEGWKIVNNEFIELLAETGILGLLSFVTVILILIIRSLKAIKVVQDEYLKALMIALLAAFLGILVQYQTFSILYIMHIWFLIGFMVAIQNLVLIKSEK